MGNVVYLYDELHAQARSRSTSPTTSMGAKGSRWAAAPQPSLPDSSTTSNADIQRLPLACGCCHVEGGQSAYDTLSASSSPTLSQQPPKIDAPTLSQAFDTHERSASSESATFIYAETDQSSDETSQETPLSSPQSAKSGTEVLASSKNLVSSPSPDQTRLIAAAEAEVQQIENDPWASWTDSSAGFQGPDAFARRQALTAASHAEQAAPTSPPSSQPSKKAAAASKWNATVSSSTKPQRQTSEPLLFSRIAKLAPQDEIKLTHPSSPPTDGLGKIPSNPAASIGEEDGWSAWTAHPQAAQGGAYAHKKRQEMAASKKIETTPTPVAPKPQKATSGTRAAPPTAPNAMLTHAMQQSKAKAPTGPAAASKKTEKPPPSPYKSWKEYHATMSQALSMLRANGEAAALPSKSTSAPPVPPPVPYKSWKEYNETMSQALKTIRAAREAGTLALKDVPTPQTPPQKAKTLSKVSSPKKLPGASNGSEVSSSSSKSSAVLGSSGFPEGSLLDQIATGASPKRRPSSSKAAVPASSVAKDLPQVVEASEVSLVDISGHDDPATNSEAALLDSEPAVASAFLELNGLCLGSPVPLADPTSPLSCFEDNDAGMFHMPMTGDILSPNLHNTSSRKHESNFSLSGESHGFQPSSTSLFCGHSTSSSHSSADRSQQYRSSSRSSSRLAKLSNLSAALETLGLDEDQEQAVLKLLQALPKRDRATCVFNKEFLKAKVEEALYIMSIDSESTESEEEL